MACGKRGSQCPLRCPRSVYPIPPTHPSPPFPLWSYSWQAIPKNDFARVLSRAALLSHLSPVLLRMVSAWTSRSADPESRRLAATYTPQIANLLLLFSQGDSVVKDHMCERHVLGGACSHSCKPEVGEVMSCGDKCAFLLT